MKNNKEAMDKIIKSLNTIAGRFKEMAEMLEHMKTITEVNTAIWPCALEKCGDALIKCFEEDVSNTKKAVDGFFYTIFDHLELLKHIYKKEIRR